MAVRLGTKVVDALLLGPTDRRRQLQDFPVLGDVWTWLAEHTTEEPPDLLIVPTWEVPAATVAGIVSSRGEAHNDEKNALSVAYLNDLVVATLGLDDLPEVVFPASKWWDDIEQGWADRADGGPDAECFADLVRAELRESVGKDGQKLFASVSTVDPPRDSWDAQAAKLGVLLGVFRAAATSFKVDDGVDGTAESGPRERLIEVVEALGVERIVDEGAGAVATVRCEYAKLAEASAGAGEARLGVIFQATLNRSAEFTLTNSVAAIKADAARSLFTISCREVAWAVLDSGIDHTHPAFLDHHEIARREKKTGGSTASAESGVPPHRIKAAFDFRRIRAILGVKNDSKLGAFAEKLAAPNALDVDEVKTLLLRVIEDRRARLPVDWRKLRRIIQIDTAKPGNLPEHPHGTHVAGIIGADWREAGGEPKLRGICPDINLYDCRVLGSDLGDSEFAVSAAIQFIRFFNEQSEHPRINGVNMSLAIRHNVRNYACGRTPVCLEAEALVAAGVVVVAAAGNRGYQSYQLADSSTFEGYAASSITDPGNADGVITVGSTHRHWPHTFGVSFFSSRGPTGDGRSKPDLLAPGEKILSCTPGGKQDQMDGTSMAAPHVSGAAALLMARHEELKGRPARIKDILCGSATDLKRERSFQGHGMVDVLRAIQSI